MSGLDHRRSHHRHQRGGGLAGALSPALLIAGAIALQSCSAVGASRVPPATPRASIAFAQAQAHLIAVDPAAARASLTEALRLDPEWVAPGRALDDLDREGLLGPEVLERRRADLERDPTSAVKLYLIGRLEGPAGLARFERGVDVDPKMAWNHHGIAWNLHSAGATRAALRHGRHALERARDTWERSHFTRAMARYELALGRADRAAALLAGRLGEADLLATDRVSLTAWLARSELASVRPDRVLRGWSRALELIASESLADDELTGLVLTLLDTPASLRGRRGELEIASALGMRDEQRRVALRAGVLMEAGSPALALALFERAGLDSPSRSHTRELRFSRGDARASLQAWLAELPSFLLGEGGLPRDPRLAALVLAGQDGGDRELAAALLAAGWFAEARAFAEDLAARDLAAAEALEARASAGVVLFEGISRLLRRIDQGERSSQSLAAREGAPNGRGQDPSLGAVESLDGLLTALEPLFADHHQAQGEGNLAADLSSSPRLSYGPAAQVVHPGPIYSASDAARGLGEFGGAVGGLAAELEALGRFGIFGQAMGGGGPDGTVLRRVLVEERSGEHLGVPWSGLVAWCDGVDVESRPARRGARISGAALHEGYWVDLDAVHEELDNWRRLERRFLGPEAKLDPLAALAVSGVRLHSGQSAGTLVSLLGEAQRVRLAVLVERAARRTDPAEPLVSLDELALLTALHEEGHLCDRTRFLPLGSNLLDGLALLARGGFSPAGVSRELESRAQLVSLCEAQDPRMPLAEVLAAAERGGDVTPHSAAYRDLLSSWLLELESVAPGFAALDPERALAHQLHRLTPLQVRAVSRSLARRRGLMR